MPRTYRMLRTHRMLRSGRLAVAVIALGIVAACGGADPTQSSTTGDETQSDRTSSAAPTDEKSQAIAYSRCMRENGVENFPDPDSEGRIRLHASPGNGMEADDPTFKAADEACKDLRSGPKEEDRDKIKAANLEFSTCMRDNGIESFPDPTADGSLQIQAEPGSELDPANPKYQAAEKACESFLPEGAGEKSLDSREEGDS